MIDLVTEGPGEETRSLHGELIPLEVLSLHFDPGGPRENAAVARHGETTFLFPLLALLLEHRQRNDGSFVNPDGAPNKEDDPLIATAMIVEALAQPLQPE